MNLQLPRRTQIGSLIQSTAEYGVYEHGDFKGTDKIHHITKKFFETLKSKSESVTLIVNQRKVLLQQIYKNLYLELKKELDVKAMYLDQVSPGTFTNYQMDTFCEPRSILVILTKNHNKKELRLLEELKKTTIHVSVICLGIPYYYTQFNIVHIQNIKTLYWFMYTFFNFNTSCTYWQFSKRFVFSPEKFYFY